MRIKYILIVTAFVFLLISCNNSTNNSSASQPAKPDTLKNIDEGQEYSDYPVDSIKVSFGNKSFWLKGSRIGDTLIAEGDIAFRVHDKNLEAVGSSWSIWPVGADGYIQLPYVISNSYAHPERIQAAIRMWENAVHIRFVPKTNEPDFVEFVPSSRSTWSSLGRVGKRQTINLQSFRDSGSIAHEIGHTLGLYHEQARSNRDEFVKVSCPNNVQFRIAFERDPYAVDYGPYNYYSIMHYGTSKCMQVRNRPANMPASIPGQRDSITTTDALAIRQIYGVN